MIAKLDTEWLDELAKQVQETVERMERTDHEWRLRVKLPCHCERCQQAREHI